MKLVLANRVYDVLKWLALIALPALSVLYTAIAEIWGLPFASEISTTINAVIAFIGVLIGISNANKTEGV